MTLIFAILRVGEKIHEKYFPPNLQGDGKKYRIFLKVSSPALTILFGRTGSVLSRRHFGNAQIKLNSSPRPLAPPYPVFAHRDGVAQPIGGYTEDTTLVYKIRQSGNIFKKNEVKKGGWENLMRKLKLG